MLLILPILTLPAILAKGLAPSTDVWKPTEVVRANQLIEKLRLDYYLSLLGEGFDNEVSRLIGKETTLEEVLQKLEKHAPFVYLLVGPRLKEALQSVTAIKDKQAQGYMEQLRDLLKGAVRAVLSHRKGLMSKDDRDKTITSVCIDALFPVLYLPPTARNEVISAVPELQQLLTLIRQIE